MAGGENVKHSFFKKNVESNAFIVFYAMAGNPRSARNGASLEGLSRTPRQSWIRDVGG